MTLKNDENKPDTSSTKDLQTSELRYRRLFEAARDGILILDAETGKIIDVNPFMIEFLGYARAEFLGRELWEIGLLENQEASLEAFRQFQKNGYIWYEHLPLITKTGEPLGIEIAGNVYMEGSRQVVQCNIRNITGRRQAEELLSVSEERLRQAQKLKSVGQLAGGIAHDFNNMLTAINGYSDLALRRLTDDDPLRHYLEEIKKAGLRSAELTHQLLAFSRQQVLQPVVFDLNNIVAETISLLQRLIGEDIQLNTVLNPKAGRVKVDPGQFSQIIMNLAVNSRDAMPRGGKLTIETANVFLAPSYTQKYIDMLPGAYVMMAVSDNGSGMSDEIRQHIFDPFFTTKELGRGTGLGLATVYGIVKQSGGNIEVYSEEGIGTTFKIYLPRVIAETDEAGIKAASIEMPKGEEKILLVEDEELVRSLSKSILEFCGYTIVEARNGAEALEICQQEDCEFDLLMTDVVMPQMGGQELAGNLAAKLPNLKILFTSGYTDDAIIRHGVIEANTNFIQKPFTPEALATKIREILDQA